MLRYAYWRFYRKAQARAGRNPSMEALTNWAGYVSAVTAPICLYVQRNYPSAFRRTFGEFLYAQSQFVAVGLYVAIAALGYFVWTRTGAFDGLAQRYATLSGWQKQTYEVMFWAWIAAGATIGIAIIAHWAPI